MRDTSLRSPLYSPLENKQIGTAMFGRLVVTSFARNAAKIRAFNGVNAVRPLSSSAVENPGLAMPKHGRKESEDEFDQRYINYFNRKDIDGWEIRKAINDMHGMDLVPEPKVVVAALNACRRVNDHALAVRYLEAIKMKSTGNPEIYPYIIQEIRPALDELGISTPEELGYGEPELALANPYEMH